MACGLSVVFSPPVLLREEEGVGKRKAFPSWTYIHVLSTNRVPKVVFMIFLISLAVCVCVCVCVFGVRMCVRVCVTEYIAVGRWK